ncbi:MAG TPA: signal peptidase I [Acholeplasmataceae bacterium]|nr:signal peptidase I [Acholeplasmataceae bacterium]
MDGLIFKNKLTNKINFIILQLLIFFILFVTLGKTRSGVKSFFVYLSFALLFFATLIGFLNLGKYKIKTKNIIYILSDFGSLFASVILSVEIIFFFVLFPASVSQNSMMNTLFDGDFIIVSPNIKIKRFDIVVAEYDNELNEDIPGLSDKEVIVKRIIGFPGDNIKFYDHKLYINGMEVNEQYFKDNKQTVTEFNFQEINNKTNDFSFEDYDFKDKLDYIEDQYYIPKGHYFLMGDNRKFSIDSRDMGVFSFDQLRGVVIFKFESFFQIKRLR